MEVKTLREKTFNGNLKVLISILYNGSQVRDFCSALTYKQATPLRGAPLGPEMLTRQEEAPDQASDQKMNSLGCVGSKPVLFFLQQFYKCTFVFFKDLFLLCTYVCLCEFMCTTCLEVPREERGCWVPWN